jgi:threonine/homoserine/homoserine lactone efflux protein
LDSSLFLRGLVLGFAIAAPVGPIGVLCIRRTLAQGRTAGLLSGLGAATADALYGSVAAFGLTVISGLLVAQRTWLGLLGGVFLCYLGARTFLAESAAALEPTRTQPGGLAGSYASTLALTLTNPMTILSFAAVFAGLGLGAGVGSFGSAASLVTGVFLGSAGWWLALSAGVSLLRGGLGAAGLRWVNRVSGVVIVAFGIGAILSVLAPLG